MEVCRRQVCGQGGMKTNEGLHANYENISLQREAKHRQEKTIVENISVYKRVSRPEKQGENLISN